MMQNMIESSKPFIVAVSGGVDSMVLLHLLSSHSKLPLVVAHVNHGMREDSHIDEDLVRETAAQYDLPFVSTRLQLSAQASEEEARNARYEWLERIRSEYDGSAIATAHHEDDIFETIFINISRGTGWRGVCSLRHTSTRARPLLGHSKAWIIDYALTHNLQWREDDTNESLRYLRNRIRHGVLPRLDASARQRLRKIYEDQCLLREDIYDEVSSTVLSAVSDESLSRHSLIMIDDSTGIELLRAWLGETLEVSRFRDLLLFSKVARPGAKWSLDADRFVAATRRSLIVESSRD